MAVELGAGYISTFPKLDESKTRAATNELENQLERAGDDAGRKAGDGFGASFGGGIRKAIGVAAAAFAGLQVGQFLKGAIDAASDLGETTAKVSQIFGSDALPALEEFAAGAATSLGQSKQSALDAAATFGVFGKSAGLTGKDLAGFSSEMVTLASDLASFGNTSPEEAIEAIGSALRGEAEPIRKYGVLLDDATLKNRAMALGIISTTKDALTPQQKVLAAQAEILAQTSDAQGDFARTSGGLANQQRILNAMLANGKTALGQLFLPAATAVVSFLVSKGIPALQGFSGAFKDTFSEIAKTVYGEGGFGESIAVEIGKSFGWMEDDSRVTAMAQFFRKIQDGIAAGFFLMRDLVVAGRDAVVEAFSALTTGFTEGEGTTAERVGLAIRDAFFLARDGAVAAKDVIFDIFQFVADHQDAFAVAGAGVAGFAAALGGLAAVNSAAAAVSNLGTGASILGQVLPLLTKGGGIGLLIALVAALGAAAFVAYKKFEPFRNVVDTVARTIRDVAVEAFERLRDVVTVVAPVVVAALSTLGAIGATAFDGVRAAIDAVVAAVGSVAAFFSAAATATIAALTPLADWINTHLIPTITAIVGAVVAFVQAVVDTIAPFVQVWIAILSPILDFTSGLFDEIYSVVSEILGVLVGFAGEQLDFLVRLFRNFADLVFPVVRATWETIVDIVRAVFNVAKAVVEAILGQIRGIFLAIQGAINGDWGQFWNGLLTVVNSTLSGVINVVASILGGVRATVANLLGGLGDVARNAVGDLGGVLYDAGWDIIQGLISGIRDAIPGVRGILGTVTNLIPDWKGPEQVDRKLLERSGRLIMEGLQAGIGGQLPALQMQLSAVTGVIERTVVAAPQVQSVAAQAPAAVPAVSPGELLSGARFAVYIDGREQQRSFVRLERSGR